MAIVRINSAAGSNLSGSSVSFIDASAASLTAGNFIVAVARWGATSNETLTSFTDTAGNTYTLLSEFQEAGNTTKLRIGYVYNALGNGSNVVRANFSGANAFVSVQTAQYSGILTTDPIDQTANGSSSTGTITSGTFTTTQADELIIAGAQVDQLSTTFTAGGGATKLQDDGTDALSELIVSSIQTGTTASFTNTDTSSTKSIVVATFKAAAGGASAVLMPQSIF